MAVNKVEFPEGNVIMDITDSTVTPETLLSGATAYNKAGNKITGEVVVEHVEVESFLDSGTKSATITIDDNSIDIYGENTKAELKKMSAEKTVTGNPVTFETINGGMAKSCEITMNPIQDLHGYEYPWAGGNGKNKLDKADSSVSANSTWLNVNCNLPAGTYTFSFKSSATSGQCTFNVFDSNGDRIYQAPNSIQLAGTVTHTFTISSAGARVSSYINVASDISEVMIEEGSTKTDFAPYENICPISGRTEVSVTRTGKNLFGGTPKYPNKVITSDGSLSDSNSYDTYEFIGGVKYIFSYIAESGFDTIRWARLSEVTNTWTRYTTTSNPITMDISNYRALRVSIGKSNFATNIQLEIGETATDYEPYNGQTKTITFPSTVYGGTDEVVGGTGVSNMAIMDLGSKTWTRSTSYTNPFFYASILSEESAALTNNGICENYAKYIPPTYVDGAYFGNHAPDNTFAINTTTGRQIFIRDDRYTSVKDFKTAMSGVHLCYKLATPTTFSTTPTPIPLNKGNNVVSTDADGLEVVYTKMITIDNIPKQINYSTEEQDTGIKWIDGRTVYQITKSITIETSGDTLIEANFGSNKNIIDIKGTAFVPYSNVTHIFPLPGYPNESNPLRFIVYLAGNDLRASAAAGNANITFLYTKTS